MPRSKRTERSLGTAALIGAVTGIRSLLLPSLAVGRLEPLRHLDTPLARALVHGLRLAATSERVVDKLPWLPPRTDVLPLAGRLVGGATMAALVVNGAPVRAAATGALFAAGAAFAATGLRRVATDRLGIPNVVSGLVEDGIATWLGRRAVRRARRSVGVGRSPG